MNTLQHTLPTVNMHICPACQLPHHWLSDACRDSNCPWVHHRDSYGRIVGLMGECRCTLRAIGENLVAIMPQSGALGCVEVCVPAFWLMAVDGANYQPTADEWLEVIGAVVDEQRSMGDRDAMEWYREEYRDAWLQGQSILRDERRMRHHHGC